MRILVQFDLPSISEVQLAPRRAPYFRFSFGLLTRVARLREAKRILNINLFLIYALSWSELFFKIIQNHLSDCLTEITSKEVRYIYKLRCPVCYKRNSLIYSFFFIFQLLSQNIYIIIFQKSCNLITGHNNRKMDMDT